MNSTAHLVRHSDSEASFLMNSDTKDFMLHDKYI